MKFFACLFALVAIASLSSADKNDKKEGLVSSSYGAPSYGAPAPAPSYGGASYAPPPCPKNYLFSCQPNLAPVPCAAGGYSGSSGGYSGAYTEHVPQYVLPPYAFQQYAGMPQY